MINAIRERISRLRKYLTLHNLDAFIVPSSDAHISEYTATHWKSRTWISGFTGSAGSAVITLNRAGLWTDSRYFIQAENELQETSVELFRVGLPETPDMLEFLSSELPEGSVVGIDGSVFTVSDVRRIRAILSKKGISLVTELDPFKEIWIDRPALPNDPIFELPDIFSGETSSEKISKILSILNKEGANCTILTALDEIAWTFNIRGTDVECNPVAVSYAFISQEESILFIELDKLTEELRETLHAQNISFADYHKFSSYLSKLESKSVLHVDPNKANFTIFESISSDCKIVESTSPVTLLKSKKNEVEINGFRNALVKDGVALTKFFIWLDNNIDSGSLTEYSIGKKLLEFREEQELFFGESFSTIAGFEANGAIVHYSASESNSKTISRSSFLLLDSGGQYFDGTTDITRTVSLGELTEQQKIDYTLVLKGHINIATCRFPEGTRGSQIDILARKAMWDRGMNYGHGTGHGIGHFLNVHEGPQSIRMDENPTKLIPGMVLSNEPGLYRAGEYGIRIENLILVKERHTTSFGRFFEFETLTLFPIDTEAIDLSLLTQDEIDWLNDYHKTVFHKLLPHLDSNEVAWLKEKTQQVKA
ncbi:MAG: aminopeptidase P family protein [Bacteroidales bacterium]